MKKPYSFPKKAYSDNIINIEARRVYLLNLFNIITIIMIATRDKTNPITWISDIYILVIYKNYTI